MIRVNIKSILGVRLTKNMSVEEMSKNLSQGISNISQKDPELCEKIMPYVQNIADLLKLQQSIVSKSQEIVTLQEKVEGYQEALTAAMIAYQESSQKAITIIGVAAGSAPPYPAAAQITQPLIQAVTEAQKALSEVKKTLKTEVKQLSEVSQEFKTQKEKVFAELTQIIAKERGDLFDPSQENFIIT